MNRRRIAHQSPHHHHHPHHVAHQTVRPSSQGPHPSSHIFGPQATTGIPVPGTMDMTRTQVGTVIDPVTGMVRPASAPFPGFQQQMIRGQMLQRQGQTQPGIFGQQQQPGMMMPGQMQPGLMGQQPGMMMGPQQQMMMGPTGQMIPGQTLAGQGMMAGQMQPGMIGQQQQPGMMGMMPGQQQMQQQPGIMGKMMQSLLPGQQTQQQQMMQQQQRPFMMGTMGQQQPLRPGIPGQMPLGMNQMGINQMGVNQMGVNQMGVNQMGVNQMGMNQMGLNQMGLNQTGMGLQTGLGTTPGMFSQQTGLIRPPGLSVHQPGVRWFLALYDYDPLTMSPNPDGADEELGFRDGDLIKVYGEKDADGFYRGEAMDGRAGFVPCNMVSEVSGPEAVQITEGGHTVPAGARKMIALYDYDPQENSPNPDADVSISY